MKQKNDMAVSPVIGVILMVAITVILAATIAAFVFSMSNDVPKTHYVSVSANQNSNDKIMFTYQGGQGTRDFQLATINITDDEGKFIKVDNLTDVVGNTIVATGKFSKNNHVVVVGFFNDDSRQILLDTYV
jgi:archaeal type IV pilus assembly protein PilA